MRWIGIVLAAALGCGAAHARVDANAASVEQLQSVAGVGPSIAGRIVEERRRGPFKDLADLEARVRGVGVASARRMAAGGLTVGPGAPRAEAAGEGRAARAGAERGEAASPDRPDARPSTRSGGRRASSGRADSRPRADPAAPARTGAPAGPWREPRAAR